MVAKAPAPAGIVGVREFRARLSAYLRAAAAGATIVVGDRRRRPLARLVPATRLPDDEALDRLAAEGVLQRGRGKPGSGRPARPREKSRLLSDIVIEQRG
jgi:antitoxin (DNA-binding transcriptional repressor) of toxin-antitoxin stability system